MPKSYWVYHTSGPMALKEAWERATAEGHTPREDKVGVMLLGKWEIFGLKPYLITLSV